MRWLNFMKFRVYTCITLIFIGSTTQVNLLKQVWTNIFKAGVFALSNGRKKRRDSCRRQIYALLCSFPPMSPQRAAMLSCLPSVRGVSNV